MEIVFRSSICVRCYVADLFRLCFLYWEVKLGMKAYNFIKKRLQHMYFPLSIAKFLRTTFLLNTSGGCFCYCRSTILQKQFIFMLTKSLKTFKSLSLRLLWWWLDITAWKVPKYGVFSGPYFPVFVLNTEIYSVNLRIQSEYRKIRTRKNPAFGHFSHSVLYWEILPSSYKNIVNHIMILWYIFIYYMLL